uniref:NADH-ubiquinone oxidoreductase chain 3 n=1 Tax=Placobdella lamothei TaxID=1514856 RepID=A0A175D0E4_9ANNE|nr:NADH dehydrogenase subunit 3 [Placobdella lamothei]CVK87339.1 NADH dehydrogenase subunit 3 [Placobdella lamothei]
MYTMTIIFALSMTIPSMVFLLSLFLYMRTSQDRHKLSPFECGFDPNSCARIPFSTRFFLLAIIFIVFDIEVVLLMPVPIIINSSPSLYCVLTLLFFFIILLMGLIHEWNEGSINWLS